MARNIRQDARKFGPPPPAPHTFGLFGGWYGCTNCGAVFVAAGRNRHQAILCFSSHVAEAKKAREECRDNLAPEWSSE